MDPSILSIVFSIIITIIYFMLPAIGKPTLTVGILNSEDGYMNYYSTYMSSLIVYVVAIVVVQLCLNIVYIGSKCGGAIGQNIGTAALYTIVPWLLVFGVMVGALLMFPGWRQAFSVISALVVSSQANEILGTILIDSDINKIIQGSSSDAEKEKLTKTAEALAKICSDKTVLISKINTENFMNMWGILMPLMKQQYTNDAAIQQQFLDVFIKKENIEEAFWYVYTAIFISSVVYYNLSLKGCVKSVEQIEAERNEIMAQQAEVDKQNALNNSVTYTA